MRIYKTVSVAKQEIDSIICNFCGNGIRKSAHGLFEDYLHIEKRWGYFSNYDGEIHTIDICLRCYEKLLENMAIKPGDADEIEDDNEKKDS